VTASLDKCLCPWDENESIVRFARGCPIHGSMAAPSETVYKPWCQGSQEAVALLTNRTGTCRACGHTVGQKYGIAGVHLPDGSVPLE